MADDPAGAATRPAGLPRQRFAIVLCALAGCVTSPDVPDPAVTEIVSGNDQVQGRGRPLHEPVVVRALDELGAPIAGARLRFSVGPGGGVVDPQDAVTDSVGVAAVSWVLGDVAGMHRMVASVPKRRGASVEIAATTRPGDFDIQVVVDSGYTKEQAAAIRTAAERWTAVIVGDVPDHRFEQGFAAIGRCAGQPDIPAGGVVDDVQFRMNFDDDPGAGFSYGICLRRMEGAGVPIVVYMRLPAPFIEFFEPHLEGFVTHILGHLLGFGWRWRDKLENPVRTLGVGADTHFPDPATIAAFNAAGGANWSGSKVPVENHGGETRVDVHWRESVLGTEIMSPEFTLVDTRGFQLKDMNRLPISAITVQAMAAIGFEVDVGMAEPYRIPPAALAAPGPVPAARSSLWRDLGLHTIDIFDQSGQLVEVVHRR